MIGRTQSFATINRTELLIPRTLKNSTDIHMFVCFEHLKVGAKMREFFIKVFRDCTFSLVTFRVLIKATRDLLIITIIPLFRNTVISRRETILTSES